MWKLLAVGTGGFLGALARFGLSGLIARLSSAGYPAGTLVVNVMGCLVIGALMSVVDERPELSAETRLFLTVGLLSSFTTFSTVALETFEMLRDRNLPLAGAHLLANVVVGLLAVWLGREGVRLLGS